MASARFKLCIITPNTLYGVFLKSVNFPNFETYVIEGAKQLESLAFNFNPEQVLIFANHFEEEPLSRLLEILSEKFPESELFVVNGETEYTVERHGSSLQKNYSDKHRVNSVLDLDASILQLMTRS